MVFGVALWRGNDASKVPLAVGGRQESGTECSECGQQRPEGRAGLPNSPDAERWLCVPCWERRQAGQQPYRCPRQGCRFLRSRWASHGCCCSKCWLGQSTHGPDCTGARQQAPAPAVASPPPARPAEPRGPNAGSAAVGHPTAAPGAAGAADPGAGQVGGGQPPEVAGLGFWRVPRISPTATLGAAGAQGEREPESSLRGAVEPRRCNGDVAASVVRGMTDAMGWPGWLVLPEEPGQAAPDGLTSPPLLARVDAGALPAAAASGPGELENMASAAETHRSAGSVPGEEPSAKRASTADAPAPTTPASHVGHLAELADAAEAEEQATSAGPSAWQRDELADATTPHEPGAPARPSATLSAEAETQAFGALVVLSEGEPAALGGQGGSRPGDAAAEAAAAALASRVPSHRPLGPGLAGAADAWEPGAAAVPNPGPAGSNKAPEPGASMAQRAATSEELVGAATCSARTRAPPACAGPVERKPTAPLQPRASQPPELAGATETQGPAASAATRGRNCSQCKDNCSEGRRGNKGTAQEDLWFCPPCWRSWDEAHRRKCGRPSCRYRRHSSQDHGYCCNACAEGRLHGPRCERVAFVKPKAKSGEAGAALKGSSSATDRKTTRFEVVDEQEVKTRGAGLRPCLRPHCPYLGHLTQGHGYCCNVCMEEGKGTHGPLCEQLRSSLIGDSRARSTPPARPQPFRAPAPTWVPAAKTRCGRGDRGSPVAPQAAMPRREGLGAGVDSRTPVAFWGIVDLKFDGRLPARDRVRVLELGDGRSSGFSQHGRLIRERFEAGYREDPAMLKRALLVENKKVTHDRFVDEGCGHLRPPAAFYPRRYSADLAQRILADLGLTQGGGHVVLKLCNRSRGAGVVVVPAQQLEQSLRLLLAPPSGQALRCLLDPGPEVLDQTFADALQESCPHWWSNECPLFVAERCCHSVPVQAGGQDFDATMRVSFVLHRKPRGGGGAGGGGGGAMYIITIIVIVIMIIIMMILI